MRIPAVRTGFAWSEKASRQGRWPSPTPASNNPLTGMTTTRPCPKCTRPNNRNALSALLLPLQIGVADGITEQAKHRHHLSFVVESVGDDVMQDERRTAWRGCPVGRSRGDDCL